MTETKTPIPFCARRVVALDGTVYIEGPRASKQPDPGHVLVYPHEAPRNQLHALLDEAGKLLTEGKRPGIYKRSDGTFVVMEIDPGVDEVTAARPSAPTEHAPARALPATALRHRPIVVGLISRVGGWS